MPFTKPTTALNLPRLDGEGPNRYTDTNEFLSPGVLIAYKARPGFIFPPPEEKTAMNAAAIQARNIVRIANEVLARVVIQRQDEPPLFTKVMERHFNLKAGDKAEGYLTDNTVNKPFEFGAIFDRDRRWALEQIRQKMLTLSFHLNTGIYLIDLDNEGRTSLAGKTVAAGTARPSTSRGYTVMRALGSNPICGFRNGEVHVDFAQFPYMSLNSGARLIIHECAHKFLSVVDTYYAWHVDYPPSLQKCLEANADSFAWTAVSLATGVLRMGTSGSTDGEKCQGTTL